MREYNCRDCNISLSGEATLKRHRDAGHSIGHRETASGVVQIGYSARESGHATVKEIARRTIQDYGSLDRFAEVVVAPELESAGLYVGGRGLTPKGQAARADLERRVGGVLREMRRRRAPWVEKEPRKALLAAVLAVAMGQDRTAEGSDLQLVERQVEQEAAQARDTHGASDQGGLWLDWHFFNRFDTYFQAVDSEVSASESGGDGDGGDGGDGGGE